MSHLGLSWSLLCAGNHGNRKNGENKQWDLSKKLEKHWVHYIAWKSADLGKAFLSLVAAMRKFLAGTLRLALVEIMDEMATLQEKINIVTQIRARIFKHLRSPEIDSKELIPPAYVAWRAGTTTLFLLGC